MKCLITGVNGVVGSNLATLLSNQYSWEISGLGASLSTYIPYHRMDLTKSDDIQRVSDEIGTCNIVIHCAALIDNKRASSDLFLTNVIGTLNAQRIAANIGATSFINISGVTVVGNIQIKPISESHPCKPLTGYLLSKLHAEEAIALYSNTENRTISLRIPSPVGLKMPERNFLPIVLGQAIRNEEIRITGDSRRRQNFLDMRDLASAIVRASGTPHLNGIYNIAAHKPTTNLELAHTIVKHTGSHSHISDLTKEQHGYFEDWDIDCSKAKRDFGFNPSFTVNDSIEWIVRNMTRCDT